MEESSAKISRRAKRAPRVARSLVALLAVWTVAGPLLARPAAGQVVHLKKKVLFLGAGQPVFFPAIAAAGGIPVESVDPKRFGEIAVIVLADFRWADVPQEVSARLGDFLSRGGALLLTGGRNGFGAGGYGAIAELVPFIIRAPSDFVAKPFKPPLLLFPGHPALAGGEFITIGNFNDMNPKPGATEILQYPGGFVPNVGRGTGTFSSPLMAEQLVGNGIVLGIAFDVADIVPRSPKGPEALASIMRYLIWQSAIPPLPPPAQR
jgi:hypothetical protein